MNSCMCSMCRTVIASTCHSHVNGPRQISNSHVMIEAQPQNRHRLFRLLNGAIFSATRHDGDQTNNWINTIALHLLGPSYASRATRRREKWSSTYEKKCVFGPERAVFAKNSFWKGSSLQKVLHDKMREEGRWRRKRPSSTASLFRGHQDVSSATEKQTRDAEPCNRGMIRENDVLHAARIGTRVANTILDPPHQAPRKCSCEWARAR